MLNRAQGFGALGFRGPGFRVLGFRGLGFRVYQHLKLHLGHSDGRVGIRDACDCADRSSFACPASSKT